MINVSEFFTIESIGDGSYSIRVYKASLKNIRILKILKRLFNEYYSDKVIIVSHTKYNLRVFCTEKMTSMDMFDILHTSILLYGNNKEELLEQILSKISLYDQTSIIALDTNV